ncbi:hypothetical protein K9L27_03975 [Candidatus Gracilibacteria bacterium]|nr:hypothetical protein [Candidatus Gracilibacteria bacterium]
MSHKKNTYRNDILLLVGFLLLAVGVSLWGQTTFLVSIFLFFGFPAAWLSYRKPERIKKLLLFSVFFTIPFVFLIDHLAVLDQSWHVPTIFPFRLLGTIPIEDYIWSVFCVYLVTMFYEYFLDKYRDKLLYQYMKYFFILSGLVLIIFFTLFFAKPDALYIQYTYLFVGIFFALLPTFVFLFHYPKLLFKFFATVPYFFVLFLAMELVALHLGHWNFPGEHFVGWINLLGQNFPFEELLFWIFLFPVSILSYYEYFNDDRR